MGNFDGLPTGTREADPVLRGGEREYYDHGLRERLFTAVSAVREDGSRLLLTDRVWERSSYAYAVEQSREAVRRNLIARGDMGGEASKLAAEAVEADEGDGWERFNRLARSLTERIADKVCSTFDDGEAGFVKFLEEGSNLFTAESRCNVVINGVTDGLDISTYNYELQHIRDFGYCSGRFPVDYEQYDAMRKRVDWIKMLEDTVSQRVSDNLKQRFADKVNCDLFSLKISILENGNCGLNVSPKRGGKIKERGTRT